MISALRMGARARIAPETPVASGSTDAQAPVVYSCDGLVAKTVSYQLPILSGETSLKRDSAQYIDVITDLLHHDTAARINLFSPGDGELWQNDRAEVRKYIDSRAKAPTDLQCYTAFQKRSWPIGIIEIQRYQRSRTHPSEANLAYWFTKTEKSPRPKGSATQLIACAVLASFARDSQIQRIYAWTENQNIQSQRVVTCAQTFAPFQYANENDWKAFSAASGEPNDPAGHTLFVKRRENLASDALTYYLRHREATVTGPKLQAGFVKVAAVQVPVPISTSSVSSAHTVA